MNYLLSGLLIVLFLSVVSLMLYSIRAKSTQIALLYLLFLSVGVYAVGYSMELLSQTVPQMLFCNIIQFVGFPFIPALWLSYVISDTHYAAKNPLRPIRFFAIFSIPMLTLIVRITNPQHHLYYVSYELAHRGFPVLILHRGPFYYILILYSIFCILYSILILLKNIKNKASFVASRSKLMIFIMAMPSLALLINFSQLIPIDLVPFSFLLSLFFFLLGFRKYHLLDEKGMLLDELQSNGNILTMVLEAIDNVIVLFDNTRKRVWLMNDTYAQIFGNPLEQDAKRAIDQILDRVHPEDKEQVGKELSFIRRASYAEMGKFEYRMRNKNDEYIWVRSTIRPIASFDRRESLVLFNINNINEERQTLEALTMRAEFDVTGIYNRATLFEKINRFLSSPEVKQGTHALLLFDIDNLKKINDNCGHCAGDQVIEGLVQIMRNKLGPQTILGRLGGDEFLAFLPDIQSKKKVEQLLSAILKESSELQARYQLPLPVSISVGIAETKNQAVSLEELYENADVALYQVKGRHKNDFCFYDSIRPVNYF